MPVDSNMENIRFGIYKDKTLEDPIEEADAGYNFNASWHMEEGAELSEYPEYKTNIQVIYSPESIMLRFIPLTNQMKGYFFTAAGTMFWTAT